MIKIGVAYATSSDQVWYDVDVHKGATIREAIEISGILDEFPEVSLEDQKVGIFGKVAHLDDILKEGGRVEIYRPITVDPKTVKRKKIPLKSKNNPAKKASL